MLWHGVDTMEYKHLRFEIKALNDQGEFEGYAAVKGNVDAYGDIIENGAFKRTIRAKRQVPILFMHDPSKPVGLSTYMQEDEKGLYTRGKLDVEGNETAKLVYSGLKAGYIDGLSIGYNVIQDGVNKRGNRLLKEIKLLEYSLITKGFAANELAMVSGFKSSHDYDRRLRELEDELKKRKSDEDEEDMPMDKFHKRISDIEDRMDDLEEQIKACVRNMNKSADSPEGTRPFFMPSDSDESTLEMKSVIGASDLPVVKGDWDGPAAEKRIWEWADGDISKVKRSYFWVDGDPKNKSAYKLPFADVREGNLVAISNALSAVKGALDGARGGVQGIPDADKKRIMAKVDAYQKRLSDEEKAFFALQEFKKYLKEVK